MSKPAKAQIPKANVLTAQVIRDDDFRRFLGYMPNPDDITGGTTKAYATYREMMTDPRIKSLVGKLVTTALSFPIRISQPQGCSRQVFEFVRSQTLFDAGFHNKAKRILMAGLKYGFSVNEMVWTQTTDTGYAPENIIARKPDRFLFDYDWNLLWNKGGTDRVALNDPYKWLVFRHEPEDESPYGTSLLRSVYWPWMFKKAGYEFWLQATEKFSVKSLLALFEMPAAPGRESDVVKRASDLANLLLGVRSGSASALANVKDVRELGGTGELASFSALVDACDVQISYGLTGQSLATGNPTTGTQALGTVHADMFTEDAKGLAKELQSLFQTAVNWTTWLNFGTDAVPPLFQFGLEQWASFDQTMKAAAAGIPVSKEAFYTIYKIPRPRNDEDQFVGIPANPQALALSDGKKKRAQLTMQL